MKKFKKSLATIPWVVVQPSSGTDLLAKLQAIIQMFSMFVGAAAILFIIVGGFQFITAAGNQENMKRAKSTVMYSIIGLVIAILAYAIVNFVVQNLK